MPKRRNFLNVRSHLEHIAIVIEGYQKWGKCPALDDEFRKLSFINRTILRKADERRKAGNRKDLYVESPR